MKRALEIAQNGLGNVSPNPMVGAVIVHNNKIIGEGYTSPYGGPHAEVNAINSVDNKIVLSESTLYVTLEPCSHFGKTPPCSDLIIKHKIPHVVISCKDPFEKVNGSGIDKLTKNGCKVELGVLEAEGKEVNKRFFTSLNKKRPYIILKWAQTKDGFVAKDNFDSKWISNSTSRKIVHKWRAEEDAILVGFNTAKYDNPTLNVRDYIGKDPLRIVIDKNLDLDNNLHLFDKKIDTICFNSIKTEKTENLSFVKIDFNHLEENILRELYLLNIQSLIIEGGSKTIQGFIDKGFWDEARVFIGDTLFTSGIRGPILRMEPNEEFFVNADKLKLYKNV